MKLLFILLIIFFDADFTQSHSSQLLDKPVVRTGHITYNAPDAVDWVYNDGNKATLPPQVLKAMRQLITDSSDLADGWHTVESLPKQINKFFSEIKILMKNNVAQQVNLKEKGGDVTIIEFSNIKSRQ